MVAHVGNLLAWSDRSCDRDQQGIVLRIIHGGTPFLYKIRQDAVGYMAGAKFCRL